MKLPVLCSQWQNHLQLFFQAIACFLSPLGLLGSTVQFRDPGFCPGELYRRDRDSHSDSKISQPNMTWHDTLLPNTDHGLEQVTKSLQTWAMGPEGRGRLDMDKSSEPGSSDSPQVGSLTFILWTFDKSFIFLKDKPFSSSASHFDFYSASTSQREHSVEELVSFKTDQSTGKREGKAFSQELAWEAPLGWAMARAGCFSIVFLTSLYPKPHSFILW